MLKAKLTLPPAPPMSLSRPRLLDLMSESLKQPLTLLCAPAGFGKTTLLSAWVNETVERPDVAWLGLDEDDNDPVRFFDYLRGALQGANVDVGRTAMAPLSGAGSPTPKDRMTSLLDEVTELDHSVVLVLDDYHAIDNPNTSDQSISPNLPPVSKWSGLCGVTRPGSIPAGADHRLSRDLPWVVPMTVFADNLAALVLDDQLRLLVPG